MATAAELPLSMQAFIATCSERQVAQLILALQETQPQNGESAASSMTAKAGVTAARTGKKQRNKKAKSDRATGGGGPKRPLNAFFAFRKYYSASLAPNTQKAISKILTAWWHADPFEAKWTILAKAYSIVRGSREKEDVPLDGFFEICAPLIGVIPADEYQQIMGWKLGPPRAGDEDKTPQLIRLFTPNLNNFPEKYTSTSLGSGDLVNHCYNVGYAVVESDRVPNVNASGSFNMALQPIDIDAANSGTTGGEQVSTTHPLSPSEVELNRVLLEALAERRASEGALSNATTAVNAAAGGIYTYNTTFDSSSHSDISNMTFDSSSHSDISNISFGAVNEFDAGNTTFDSTIQFDFSNTTFDPTSQFDFSDTTFDPTTQFDFSYNPAVIEDGGVWHGSDVAMTGNGNGINEIDWNAFVNDDGLA